MSTRLSFQHHSFIPARLTDIWAFHAHPEALRQLTPPPIILKIHHDARVSLTEGELDFTLWFGPIPIRWRAAHEPGPTANAFIDRMISGPMAYWEHSHIFEEHDGGVRLTDRIHYAHKPGIPGLLSRLLFGRFALRLLFLYRHWRTRRTLRKGAGETKRGEERASSGAEPS